MAFESDKKMNVGYIIKKISFYCCFLAVALFIVWILLGSRLECSCGKKGFFNFYFSPTDNGVYICEDCALEKYKELPEEKKINFIYYWFNG